MRRASTNASWRDRRMRDHFSGANCCDSLCTYEQVKTRFAADTSPTATIRITTTCSASSTRPLATHRLEARVVSPRREIPGVPATCPDCDDVPLLADLPGRWLCPDCGRGWARSGSGELVPND